MSKKEIPESGKCKELYQMLMFLFPSFKNQISYYGPLDRKTLRFQTYQGNNYIFEFDNDKSWSLQTERKYFNSSHPKQGLL